MPQRQRMHPKFMHHTKETSKHTKASQTIKSATSKWLSMLTQSLYSYNWDNANSGVITFKPSKKLTSFVHFINH